MKKWVMLNQRCYNFDSNTVEGFLKNLRDYLDKVIPSDAESLSISIEENDEDGGSPIMAVRFQADETKEDAAKRKEVEAQRRAIRKAQFESLKKEFGK